MTQPRRSLELIESIPQLHWVLRSPDLRHVLTSMDQVLLRSQRTAEMSLRRFRPKDRHEIISRDAANLAMGALKDWLLAPPEPLTSTEALIDYLSQYPLAQLGLPPAGR